MQSFWLRNRAGISILSCQIMSAFTKTRGIYAKFRVKTVSKSNHDDYAMWDF